MARRQASACCFSNNFNLYKLLNLQCFFLIFEFGNEKKIFFEKCLKKWSSNLSFLSAREPYLYHFWLSQLLTLSLHSLCLNYVYTCICFIILTYICFIFLTIRELAVGFLRGGSQQCGSNQMEGGIDGYADRKQFIFRQQDWI